MLNKLNELKRLEFFSRLWSDLHDHRDTLDIPLEAIKSIIPTQEVVEDAYTKTTNSFFDNEFIHLSEKEMENIIENLPRGYLQFEARRRRRAIYGKKENNHAD